MQQLLRCAAALALAACVSDSNDPSDEARRRKDAGMATPATGADAAISAPDAATTTPDDPAGTVACYTEGAPSNTCTAPEQCCFSNYSSHHNGFCTTSACAWGTITCDGPEDCAAGEECCATALDWGWTLACQSGACGTPPASEELCHTSDTCESGETCVSALDANYSLPRALSVCR